VIKGLEHLSSGERVRELRLVGQKKRMLKGILSMGIKYRRG